MTRGIFFNNVAGLIPAKNLRHRCFLDSFTKLLWTPFFTEHFRATALMVKKINSVSLIFVNSQLYHALPEGHFYFGVTKNTC